MLLPVKIAIIVFFIILVIWRIIADILYRKRRHKTPQQPTNTNDIEDGETYVPIVHNQQIGRDVQELVRELEDKTPGLAERLNTPLIEWPNEEDTGVIYSSSDDITPSGYHPESIIVRD